MSVRLTRAAARAGRTALRFDLSGLGDSANRLDAMALLDSACSDIREAIDWLAQHKKTERVVLLGLCAGADHAVIYAHADPRVAGIALLDPNIPRTRKFYLNDSARRLSRLAGKSPAQAISSITNLVKRGSQKAWSSVSDDGSAATGGTSNASDYGAVADDTLSDAQLHAMFQPHYRQCAEKQIEMLAVFTGDQPEYRNYREQLLEAFPDVDFARVLRLEYLAACDHTFTSEANYAALEGIVTGWLAERCA